jgi:hypothetical protein
MVFDLQVKPHASQYATAEFLRSARPHLICCVTHHTSNASLEFAYHINEKELGWDNTVSEGYDLHDSPLGCPVYWRVIMWGNKWLYCNTFLLPRDDVIRGWGPRALVFCDPVTATAAVRLQTYIRRQSSQRRGRN